MPPKGRMIGEVLNLSGALSILMMNLLLLSGRFCTVSVITIKGTSVILIEFTEKIILLRITLIIILFSPIVIFGLSSFVLISEEILFAFSKDFLVFDILEDHTDIQ